MTWPLAVGTPKALLEKFDSNADLVGSAINFLSWVMEGRHSQNPPIDTGNKIDQLPSPEIPSIDGQSSPIAVDRIKKAAVCNR